MITEKMLFDILIQRTTEQTIQLQLRRCKTPRHTVLLQTISRRVSGKPTNGTIPSSSCIRIVRASAKIPMLSVRHVPGTTLCWLNHSVTSSGFTWLRIELFQIIISQIERCHFCKYIPIKFLIVAYFT